MWGCITSCHTQLTYAAAPPTLQQHLMSCTTSQHARSHTTCVCTIGAPVLQQELVVSVLCVSLMLRPSWCAYAVSFFTTVARVLPCMMKQHRQAARAAESEGHTHTPFSCTEQRITRSQRLVLGDQAHKPPNPTPQSRAELHLNGAADECMRTMHVPHTRPAPAPSQRAGGHQWGQQRCLRPRGLLPSPHPG